MNIFKIMSELDEYKQNIPENLYIQLANLLKEKYNYNNVKENLDEINDYEEESDISSVENNEDIDRTIELCVRFKYVTRYEKICLKYIKLPFKQYYILIENNNIDTHNDDLDIIQEILTEYILDSLPTEALEEIIEAEGGYLRGHKRLQTYLGKNYESQYKFHSLSNYKQLRMMAYHIIDHIIFEYEYVNNNIPSLLNTNTVELRTFVKSIEEIYDMYIINKLHEEPKD